MSIRRGTLTTGIALILGWALAGAAWADAPSAVPGSTQGTVVVNGDGSRTVTVHGQWTWPSQTSDCNLSRAGAGFAVAWGDPAQAGNSVATLNGSNVAVGAASASLLNPADDLVHATPPGTDSTSTSLWRSGCGTFATPPGYNTGTWGPTSHTYPVSYTGAIALCPLFYDVQGTASGGPSSASQILAGGTGHNADNSAQDNAATAAGNECPAATLKSAPSVSSSPSSSVVGTASSAAAALSGGYVPSGTVSFAVYGPGDATCSTAPVFTGSVPGNGNGNYTSPSFTAGQTGTYQWVVSYSGDASNQSASSTCGAAPETVGKAAPSVSLSAPSSATVGDSGSAKATLTGGSAPGGTMSFAVYGPGDANCSAVPVLTASAAVSGDGDYASPGFTPTQAGTYRWVVSYSGDGANQAASSSCGAANETVSPATSPPPPAGPQPLDLTAPPAVLTSLPLAPPVPTVKPVLGESVALAPTAGTVLVNVPGSHGARPLGAGESLPVGTTVDARNGVVLLASARDANGDPQFATAGGGIFQVLQTHASGMTQLVLTTHKLAQLCAANPRPRHATRRWAHHKLAIAARTARKRPNRKVVNLLWSNDNHGQFSTRGQESVALVRGTSWVTAETCDGTLTGVLHGQVVVHDHHAGRVVVLNAGQSYLARR